MSTSKEILIRAKALISSPENWGYGELAQTTNGFTVPIHDQRARCFCALGAIARAALDVGVLDAVTLSNGRARGSYRIFDEIPGTQELAEAFVANGIYKANDIYKWPGDTEIREPSSVVWNVNDRLGLGDKILGHDVLMCLFDDAIHRTE